MTFKKYKVAQKVMLLCLTARILKSLVAECFADISQQFWTTEACNWHLQGGPKSKAVLLWLFASLKHLAMDLSV